MADTNYYSTLITVAPDYEGEPAKVPKPRAKPTIAQLQYEMLIDAPFEHTQEDVLFGVWLQRQELGDLAADEIAALRTDFFAKDQACLRASPLTKTHGWGVLFDADGRAALVPADSQEYEHALDSGDYTVLAAMRSRRA